MQATINIPFISASQSGPEHIDYVLTRAKFEQITSELLDRCKGPLQRALEDAKLKPSQLDEIVLVGGSTRSAILEY